VPTRPPRYATAAPHLAASPPSVWHARQGAAGQSQTLVADSSRATGTGTTTAAVTVTCPQNILVVAFVTWDKAANTAGVSTMSGGGFTWVPAAAANTNSAANGGGAEIHTAYAAGGLSAQVLTASVASGLATALTIVTFAGAAAYQHGAGARQDNAAAALFSQAVTNQVDGSWVWAVAINFDTTTTGTAGAGQTIVRSYVDGASDGCWVQSTTAATAGVGNVVTVSDTAPSVHGHLAVIEVIPAFASWVPPVVSPFSGTV
jgi:hypothetical protein